jgi:hypothetical protein
MGYRISTKRRERLSDREIVPQLLEFDSGFALAFGRTATISPKAAMGVSVDSEQLVALSSKSFTNVLSGLHQAHRSTGIRRALRRHRARCSAL